MPKKPKLSPEEKKKLAQELKIAKQLAIEEGERQVKRDELSREIKLGEFNRKKLVKRWHDIMMKIKIPEVYVELQVVINNVDYIFDLKDYLISILMDELDQADEQYNVNFRNHCKNMSNIYQLYLVRLNDLKKDYDNELVYLQDSLAEQLKKQSDDSTSAETFLKTVIYGLSVQEKQIQTLDRSIYMSNIKEQEKKNQDEMVLRQKKEGTIFEGLWKNYVNHIQNYINQTGQTDKDFKERFERDNEIVKIIRRQTNEIFNCTNTLRNTKECQLSYRDKFGTKLEELKEEKQYFHQIFLNLRQTYLFDLNYDHKILSDLVTESDIHIKSLKSYEILAEKILRMYALTRKHETKREKILAFPKTIPKKYKVWEPEWGNLKHLASFWQKCSLAETGKHYIITENMHLLKENEILKETIKDCIKYKCNKKFPQVSPYQEKLLLDSQGVHVVRNI